MEMRFHQKAQENLEAADLLSSSLERRAKPNAAASRAYYAAYLALADRAQSGGVPFTGKKPYYRHDTLPNDAVRWGLLGPDDAEDLEWLRNLRIKADYREDLVSTEEASEGRSVGSRLVARLLNRAPA